MINEHDELETLKNEIALCDEWLSEFCYHSDKWSENTSYYYKHRVEAFFDTYISNTAFITSAKKRFESKLAEGSKLNYVFKFQFDKKKMQAYKR